MGGPEIVACARPTSRAAGRALGLAERDKAPRILGPRRLRRSVLWECPGTGKALIDAAGAIV